MQEYWSWGSHGAQVKRSTNDCLITGLVPAHAMKNLWATTPYCFCWLLVGASLRQWSSHQCINVHYITKSIGLPKCLEPDVNRLAWPQVYKIKHSGMPTVFTNLFERMGCSQELSELQSGAIIGQIQS